MTKAAIQTAVKLCTKFLPAIMSAAVRFDFEVMFDTYIEEVK